MDKEKLFKKKVSDIKDYLPIPPPNPSYQSNQLNQSILQSTISIHQQKSSILQRLLDYKDRETIFLKNLNETIEMDCKKMKCENDKNISNINNIHHDNKLTNKSECELLKDECENYILPLLNRTGPSISAALVAYDAFEQLNRLHGLLDQMLTIQEQNYQMRRYLRDVKTLCELKKLQKKDTHDLLNEGEISDHELDLDNSASLLSTILAAGNSASTKRNSSKRQRERSKSVITDDIQNFTDKENKPSQPRRQSVFSESKGKVSKWTKVKAAFKWERANVPVLNEGKSSDSGIGLTPVNHEVARYLRVPSVPCTASSADSILSSSSGHLLSGGSIPATPGTISSASSIEDVGAASEELRNRDSSKSDSRCDSRPNEEETRRSRSLDGDTVITPIGQNKNKTPWKKVKDIIQTHRGSFKGKSRSRSIKSTGSITGSRDASPCESFDTTVSNFDDRNEGYSSNQTSPTTKNVPISLNDQECVTFSSSYSGSGRDETDLKLSKSSSKNFRKSRILSDFESLPEGVIADLKTTYNQHKLPPSPLNLSGRQDSSDAEFGDYSYSPIVFLKSPTKGLKPKKQHTPGNSSVPSSPSRHSEFFGEFESEDLSSGDFSEPTTPHRKLSPKSSLQSQQDEINERYLELREKLNREFETKRQEWEKIRAACSVTTSCAHQLLVKEEGGVFHKNVPTKLLEENLSADFKKKLHKWRVKKQNSISNVKDAQTSPTKENEPKKIDWNLWKTGQIKLEGQGLTPLPDQKDLPEDFQKKLEQWKKMKESNTIPPYNSQDSLKRKSISGIKIDTSKKCKDDDKGDKEKRVDRDKTKPHEKDKLEKLSMLKAIVSDPPAKEIEVQTSVGVMKFEGISRKFTRKLYEWEKARGIGPESSTFALLHPGYRPLDVGNVVQDKKSNETSPTLGRSLSLDSVSPNPSAPSISHQPSSLSLNDMDELKEANSDRMISSTLELVEKDQMDEPEAVIVEVEDDIVETAAPLVTAIPIIEQQMPVYKYEVPCDDFCARTREIITRNDRSCNRLSSQTLENVNNLKVFLHDHQVDYKQHIRHFQSILSSLKDSVPDIERCTREGSPQEHTTLDTVKNLISELTAMLDSLSEDETCCKQLLSKMSTAIDSKLKALEKNINLVCKYVDKRKYSDQIPEINITSDDGVDKSVAIVSTTPAIFQTQVVINQPKVLTAAPSQTNLELPDNGDSNVNDPSAKKLHRNLSNNSKKKTRLRKMGSRQNSKTESDSSDEETTNVVLEAPRRLKRKTSRAKKISEDDKKNEDKKDDVYTGEDVVYVLKIKPGQVIEQREISKDIPDSKVLISPTESCVQLMEAPQDNVSNSANVFVKTRRKIFTTVEEPFGESRSVIVKDLESSSASDRNEKDGVDSEKSTYVLRSLPPIPQSPNLQNKSAQKTPLQSKEPSPSIKSMIAKYNQKIAIEQGKTSGSSGSGSVSPVKIRSPVLDHRVKNQTIKYEGKTEHVTKSASAGNLRQNETTIAVEIDKVNNSKEKRMSKSNSIDTIPYNWKNSDDTVPNVLDDDYKPPLACDSLKLLHKQNRPLLKAAPPLDPDQPKKEHIYRKNKEKPTTLFPKGFSSKKIGTKSAKSEFIWRRSVSSSTGSESVTTPDKSDNTLPKIIRKLEGSKTCPINSTSVFPEGTYFPSASAPTTPLEDAGKPKTPLSERAQKLQRAKEDFLRGHLVRAPSEEINEEIWKKRLSQVSIGSESSNENRVLSKSASVGVIDTCTADNEHIGGYVSLPRTVSRSAKLTSKFGFSTLASKFRKVKMRRGSKDQSKMTAVSALCRQSLAIDILPEERRSLSQKLFGSHDNNLPKSSSSQTLGFGTLFKKHERDKINKSKSTNTVLDESNYPK